MKSVFPLGVLGALGVLAQRIFVGASRFTLCALFVLCGCDPGKPSSSQPNPNQPRARSLTVLAAASLTESFNELGSRFENAHPGVRVTFNFAGSQQLRAQLEHGAPADVFASANRTEMDAAVRAGTVAPNSVATFDRNRLVVIRPADDRAGIRTLADLARPGVKLVIADPAVPVGGYTMRMLDAMGRDPDYGPDFKTRVLGNVVSREENVKGVVGKVRLGEADAGVAYVTDVARPKGGRGTTSPATELATIEVPDEFNQVAEYPAGVAAKAREPELAKQFVELLRSADGQAVLAKYGFLAASDR